MEKNSGNKNSDIFSIFNTVTTRFVFDFDYPSSDILMSDNVKCIITLTFRTDK